MKIDELPKDMQEAIIMLKNNSATIEADVLQALDEAKDTESFIESIKTAMNDLEEEINSTRQLLCRTA